MVEKKIIKKVLIANRGEIAVRIIRACQELQIRTVAVYSTVDRDSLHTKIADESVCIGPAPSLKSYLSIPSIISAAEMAGVDAIHPGYGFLSENKNFAEICEKHDLIFIGPTSKTIGVLGDKIKARALAKSANVPMLPGSDGPVENFQQAQAVCSSIGYPVIIKAAAGGGGRGMKIVRAASELKNQYEIARSEAQTCFGNDQVFVERYCENPRHIEVQIAADEHGNVVALGERDCTIQRRHQKLIEEAPCPILDEKTRREVHATAVNLVKAANYVSMGTVEFLYDAKLKEFYFMEVNTRIQVEHPVTEMVTRTDLIKEMLFIAMGRTLSFTSDEVAMVGHSMECRINAEDPKSFAPWPGKVTAYHQPGGPGVRVDGFIYADYTVPSNYDSMIVKLITFGKDRQECLSRMLRSLREMKIDGIRTNINFHERVIQDKNFICNDYTTKFLENF